jgi:hypothetical protein
LNKSAHLTFSQNPSEVIEKELKMFNIIKEQKKKKKERQKERKEKERKKLSRFN